MLARRLLPLFLVVVPALGWLRLEGEAAGLYLPETGVALMVLASVVGSAAVVLYLARALNRIAAEREAAVAVEHRVAALVEASNEAILSADTEGVITSWNPAASQLYGYSPDEIVGLPLSTLTPPGTTEDPTRLPGPVLAGERVTGYETPRLHKDGAVLEVELAVTPITEAGRVVGACAVSRDISESMRAKETLEAMVQNRTVELACAREETLRCLARAGEYRDDDTALHTERVGMNAVLVAEQLGLAESFVTLLRQAASLHDVGKIGIPDDILLKPGKLTPEEFEVMKQHTVMGSALLSGSASEILQLAEQVTLTHHERWDGTGYPAGLAGEEIPIAGRIVAVVDSFDAMTNARPYKLASAPDEALAEISRCSVKQFDPAVVAAFIQVDHEQRAERPGSTADPRPPVVDVDGL